MKGRKKGNPEYKKEEKNAKKEFENSLQKIIEVLPNDLDEYFKNYHYFSISKT